VGPTAALDKVREGNLTYPCRESNPGRPIHSASHTHSRAHYKGKGKP